MESNTDYTDKEYMDQTDMKTMEATEELDKEEAARLLRREKANAKYQDSKQKSLCPICVKVETTGGYCDSCKVRQREIFFRRKLKIFLKYGKACYCCGENRLAFLTIARIGGGGVQQKKEVKDFYSWLVRNDFPPGYQVACSNCNSGASLNQGICPHKTGSP